jgi:hypothetical protein
LPLRRNPALCVVKFFRDLDVCFSCRKTPQELFLAGAYVWNVVRKARHAAWATSVKEQRED